MTASALALVLAPMAGLSSLPTAQAVVPVMQERDSTVVTADPLPTVQIDSGVIWAQTVIGNTVYAGGNFSQTRPAGAAPGTNLTPRSNLLAYDIRTGNLVTGFAPQIGGQVKAVAASPDGTRIYVGGTFTQVNGTTKFNLAALDARTGALITTFKASAGGSYVNAIAVTNDAIYVGGLLGAGNGVARRHLMAFNPAGQLLGWAPTADLQVDAMVVNPQKTKVIVGGRFSTVNNQPQRGLVALDPVNGAILPWAAPQSIKNGWNGPTDAGKAGIFSLSADETQVYGTGWVFANASIGNLEGVFSADGETGNIRWIMDCHGDAYSAYSDNDNVYMSGHPHDCRTVGAFPQKDPAPGNVRHSMAMSTEVQGTLGNASGVPHYFDWAGTPSPGISNWFPEWVTGSFTGQGQAGWTTVGTGDYVAYGGEFPFVNGQRQQGLVRFARPGTSPSASGPVLNSTRWVPTALSVRPGAVRVSIPLNYDRDNLDLTYSLYRQGSNTPLTEGVTLDSRFWGTGSVRLEATGLTPGQSVALQVVAEDSDGNQSRSAPVTTTVADGQISAYANEILASDPLIYWRMGSPSQAGVDWASGYDGTVGPGVAAAPGAIVNDSSQASTMSGDDNGRIIGRDLLNAGNVFTVEAWIKTTSTNGGKIIGYGGASSGTSSNYDRHVYMLNDGRIVFGVYPGTVRTLTSGNAYNDGQWHHVAAAMDGSGMRLLVDGVQVGADASTTTAEGYSGYWRVGGDNLNGWPGPYNSTNFAGDIDEAAVYPTGLSNATLKRHSDLGRVVLTPSFTNTVSGLNASFDARASQAGQGRTISSYAWNFGDGETGTGATTTHAYTEAGTYTVELTITDNQGVTARTTRSVTVDAPHRGPTAVATTSTDGLTLSFDGRTSTAGDAPVSSYAWDFGDGTTSTQSNGTRRYAEAGTYTVRLVVTDSTGAASQPVTKQVTVTHAAPVARATSTVDELTVDVDGSTSTASDGAALSYSWNWGDGSAASSGATASHVFAEAGEQTITLTVTDALGSTDTEEITVTTVEPTTPAGPVAVDTFSRSVASGWGNAETGGAWSSNSRLSVANGQGVQTVPARTRVRSMLESVDATDVDVKVGFTLDKIGNGGGSHVDVLAHANSTGYYHTKAIITSTGSTRIALYRTVGTTETLLASRPLSGANLAAGERVNVRFQVDGDGSTSTLRVKAWRTGAEPSAWLVTATDTTASLQDGGQVGLSGYLASSATNGPIQVSFDDLNVERM